MASKTRKLSQINAVGTVEETKPKLHDDLAVIDQDTLTFQDASVPLPGRHVQNTHGDVLNILLLPEHEVAALLALINQVLDSPYVTASVAAKRDLGWVRQRLQDIKIDPSLVSVRGESIIQAVPSLDL